MKTWIQRFVDIKTLRNTWLFLMLTYPFCVLVQSQIMPGFSENWPMIIAGGIVYSLVMFMLALGLSFKHWFFKYGLFYVAAGALTLVVS